MMVIASGVVVLSLSAWTRESNLSIGTCETPAKDGRQICYVNGSLGTVGQTISAYAADSHWVATGSIVSVAGARTKVDFDEATEVIRPGYPVTNNSRLEDGVLDYRYSFSKPDVIL